MVKKVYKKMIVGLFAVLICVIGYVCIAEHTKKEDAPLPVDEETMLHSLNEYMGDRVPASATNPHVLFADAKSGMIVFGQGEKTMIFVTEDGGVTWEQTAIPAAGETWHAVVTGAAAINAQAYCVGYRYWGTNTGVNLYLTKDRGETWQQLTPETALPEEITGNMRYAEVAGVAYEDEKLLIQISCKTVSGVPWSMEVEAASGDFGETWEIIEIKEKATDEE